MILLAAFSFALFLTYFILPIFSDEKMDFLSKLKKPPAEEEKAKDMLFDTSAFKANKHQKLSLEAKRVLTILPQYRMDSEVHYVS